MEYMGRHKRGRQTRAAGRRPRSLSKAASSSRTSPASHSRALPDFDGLLGRFSDALSLVTVVRRSLSALESAPIADEEVALAQAIDALKAVYNELDATTALIRSATLGRLALQRTNERK